jgi:hypothetical protein
LARGWYRRSNILIPGNAETLCKRPASGEVEPGYLGRLAGHVPPEQGHILSLAA